MTLTSLLAALYRDFNYTVTPPAAITTRLTYYLNRAQRELLTIPGLERLRDSVTPVTAFANTARTGLAVDVARIHKVTDRTNQISLVQVPLNVLRIIDPGQAFTGGYPWRYAVVGNQATQLQPATTGLWAASSAAGDTTQHVFVEGILTGGYPQNTIAAGTLLTGTSRVAIGARTDFIEVTKFYLDAVGVGFISLYDAAVAGNELARIPIGDTFSRYLAVEWFPIPTVNTTESVDYERRIFDMVNGTDEPLLPPDFHYLMELGAKVMEYEQVDDTRTTVARSEYEQGKTALKSFVMNDGDRIASLRPTRMGWNRLGPTYPNQGWPG